MTYDEIKAILSRCSYKEGYVFTLRYESDYRVRIGLQTPLLPDTSGAFKNGVQITFDLRIDVGLITSEHQLFVALEELILRWEKHEAYEWFKCDGKRVYDPHTLV